MTAMTHPTDEALVLYRWGEGDAAAVREHLVACPPCRERDASYVAVLAAVSQALEPDSAEGSTKASTEDLWAHLAPRLREPAPEPRLLRLQIRPFVPPLAAAALLAVAFLAGRLWPAHRPLPEASKVEIRERILLVAVSDHFDRSQILLLELANAPAGGTIDVSSEKARASDLLLSNRLYRQTAASSGDPMIQSVLDDLERVLLDVAHGPSQLGESELDALRRRIESQGLLFKVRVLGSRAKTPENIQERNRT